MGGGGHRRLEEGPGMEQARAAVARSRVTRSQGGRDGDGWKNASVKTADTWR